jgi:hypothetical protein
MSPRRAGCWRCGTRKGLKRDGVACQKHPRGRPRRREPTTAQIERLLLAIEARQTRRRAA